MADCIGFTNALFFSLYITGVIYCIGIECYSRYNNKSIIYNLDGSIDYRATDKQFGCIREL
jgi:hypothetical protein